MGIVSHFIKLFKWAGNKVSEHPSSSFLPPSSSTTRSSAPTPTHAPADPSSSTPPLNVKTSMFALPTIANDKEEMKKGVSLNVILDLDPSEQVSAAAVQRLEYKLNSCIGCQEGCEGKSICLFSFKGHKY